MLEVLVVDYNVNFDEVNMAEIICKWPIVFKALHRVIVIVHWLTRNKPLRLERLIHSI